MTREEMHRASFWCVGHCTLEYDPFRPSTLEGADSQKAAAPPLAEGRGIGWQSSEAETELPGRLCGALEGLGIPALVRVVAQGRFAPRPPEAMGGGPVRDAQDRMGARGAALTRACWAWRRRIWVGLPCRDRAL